jgi:hypothetical protein
MAQFQKGQHTGAHRPKGARNWIQHDVIEAFAEHWERHGKDAIDIVFKERPSDYLRFAGQFLPRETIIDDSRPEESMTDEQLTEALDKLRLVGGKAAS